MKKMYLCFIILVIVLTGCNSNKSINTRVLPFGLNEKLNDKMVSRDYDVEIYSVNENLLNGSIINMNSNPIIFKTEELFVLNMKTDNITFYKIEQNGRVYDFKMIGDLIYYIVLNETDTEKFKWNFSVYNPISKENRTLREGIINDPINPPMILGNIHDELVLFFINNDGITIEYEFTKYSDSQFKILFSGSGSVKEDIGLIPYNVYNYYINNNNLYYTLLDEMGNQRLYSYNLENNNNDLLFENDKSFGFLDSYKINDKYKYFQITHSYEKESDVIVQKGNANYQKFKSEVNTFANFIDNDTILFHNTGDNWKTLNLDSLMSTSINIATDSMPLYHYIQKNKVLIRLKNGEYKIVEFNKKD